MSTTPNAAEQAAKEAAAAAAEKAAADKAKKAAKTQTVEDKPFTGKLAPARITLAEQKRNVWVIVPELGVPYEAIVNDPAFLSHVASYLRPFDRIEVLPEDGSYFAELIVRSAGRQHAKLSELRKVDLEAIAVDTDSRFRVAFQGAHKKHVVVRTRDNTPLQGGFDTAESAYAWLLANVKSLAA